MRDDFDSDGFDYAEPEPCPACNSDGFPLGTLGRLTWYRCRHCGMEFNRQNTLATLERNDA